MNENPFPNMSDEEIVQTGKRFGYGNWLQPIINANDTAEVTSEAPTMTPVSEPCGRRGRGRPRVNKTRDQSAAEKRRAQVREAQRSYQKRKDTATATERRRADDLLQVLSDLSADVEALLQAASKAGTMYHDDDVSKRIQSLWQTYDTAINSDCVKPELRLQQIKNDQRQAQHKADGNFVVMSPTGGAATENDPLSFRRKVVPFNPEGINFDLTPTDNNDNNVVQCMMVLGDNRSVKGRSIFNIAKERQAALKAADYTHRELSVQFIAPTMEN